MEEGRDAIKAREAARREDSVAVLVPRWITGIYYSGSDNNTELREQFQKSLLSLARAVGVEEKNLHHWDSGVMRLFDPKYAERAQDDVYTMPQEVAQHLRAVLGAVHALIKDAHAAGKSQGANLLTGLASGELSVDEFNESSIKCGLSEKGS